MKPNYKTLPDQPLWVDPDGVIRFVENRIVGYMLELLQNQRPQAFDLNILAGMMCRGMFTPEEYAQFSQLHGYSVSGFGDLSQVPKKIVARCDAAAENYREAR